jgi:ABC-2 type transport system ATP-binding protein
VIVEAQNLSHRYGERAALDGLSFAVAAGEVYGILGPNGSGKSTLFQILSTLMLPSAGTALIGGADVCQNPAAVRRTIGVVFQSQSIDKKLTVWENLTSQGHLFGLSGAVLRSRAGEALERLGLAERRNELAGVLSGGLRRRVEIAKALLHEPRVLLMDEPSTGLDPGARRELWRYILDIRARRSLTVLLTTHILEEAEHCTRLMLLHEGKKVAEDTPAALKARVGGDVVALTATGKAEELCEKVQRRFPVIAHVADSIVRVEIPDGHRFVADVVEAFPGMIDAVALHKPSLEDVFLDLTGATIE